MARPPFYQEDDDLDLERELADLERNMADTKNGMDFMSDRAREIRKTLEAKQMDPVVKEALRLAQLAGHALGANEMLGNKLKNLNTRIEARDKRIAELEEENINDQGWRERALAAEATLERSRKARRRR